MRADQIQPKKLVIFDIDDTLVHTQTKVHVIKNGGVIKSLNSHDFTHYKLQPGESFDFGDFRNAREFFLKSRPIIPMMNQLKKDIATGNKVVMVTAREDFDDKELFLDTFRKYGIDIDRVHVYRAGNIKTGSTEQRKQQIIKNLLDKDNYTKAIMYDDAKPNLHSFMALKKTNPQTRFYAWLVNLAGQASEYMRENTVNERKKKRRPRWAAYGPGLYGGYGYYAGYSGDSSGGDSGVGEGEVVNFPNLFQAKSLAQELIKVTRDADDPDRGLKFNKYYVELEKLGFKPFLKGGQFYLIHIKTNNSIPLNIREDAVKDLAKDLKNPYSYDAIDHMMQTIAKKNKITAKKLHDLFVEKYKKTPDEWIKGKLKETNIGAVRQPLVPPVNRVNQDPTRTRYGDVPRKDDPSPQIAQDKLPVSNYNLDAMLKQIALAKKIVDSMYENFADGKKPGRKGLAKRSGVNCKQSVTKLRSIAKNSSGERQRMAHWCANMKSGRNK